MSGIGNTVQFVAVTAYCVCVLTVSARSAVKRLLDSLFTLQTAMLASNADTKSLLLADDSSSLQHTDTQ